MNNNDILIRLRYALDIKDTDMIEIFKLGGVTVTREELKKLLIKPDSTTTADNTGMACDNHRLESFLNGMIIFKRGKKEQKPGEKENQEFIIKDSRGVNNVMLKKVKIALSLTSDDMLQIFKNVGIDLSNSELSAVLRKEGQRNYKECQDRYARNFLKGLSMKYRG